MVAGYSHDSKARVIDPLRNGSIGDEFGSPGGVLRGSHKFL